MGSPVPRGCVTFPGAAVGKGKEGRSLARFLLNSASALQQQPVVSAFPLSCTQGFCRMALPHHPTVALGALLGWGRTCWSWSKAVLSSEP